ncbi:hypothetical protein AMS68_002444 [Peltaster fructicola]|uniref:Phosphatidylethanolamine-binding protein n=1 Tax=Peltaster fructicola TaxID=286661 RepID=A0A6H0XQ95_9PEZI|nr:hypothetical protein AMS68_002444 [Peltaster fructicola]
MLARCSLLPLLFGVVFAAEQQPLTTSHSVGLNEELLNKLHDANIIPNIIDAFVPKVNISAYWKNGTALYGNVLDPENLSKRPTIDFLAWPEDLSITKRHKMPQLTLALTDPDAPSNDDPKWSQVCHWLATHPPSNGEDVRSMKKSYKEIIEYKPPGPPPKTGMHRYILVALAPLNGTTDKLHLSKPKDRQHWGYDGNRTGVREWAEENGLGVIGANFFYAQNSKQ